MDESRRERAQRELELLAQVGPFRLLHGSTKAVDAPVDNPASIAKVGGHAGPVLVRVAGVPGAAGLVAIGGQNALGAEGSVTFDAAAEQVTEILLPGEELWAMSLTAAVIRLLVTQAALPPPHPEAKP